MKALVWPNLGQERYLNDFGEGDTIWGNSGKQTVSNV